MAVLKTKVSYGEKNLLKINFSCNSLEICCEYSYKSSLQMTTFQFLITWKVTDLLHQKHVFICKNQEKSKFFLVVKIKTSYFMIGEDNHKKRGGRLLAMTSSSTTLSFISLSQLLTSWRRMTSLWRNDVNDVWSLFNLYTMSETIMGIYCVNFRSITPILYYLLIFFVLEVAAP